MALPQILQGAQLLGGIAGLFGSHQSAAQRRAQQQLDQQNALNAQMLKKFLGMDAGQSDQAAINMAQALAEHALENANNANYGNAIKGGMAPGDTGYAVMQNRSANDILDPLKMEIAQMKASQAQRNLQNAMSVVRAFGPAATLGQQQSVSQMSQPYDPSGAYNMISGAINGFMQPHASSGGNPVGSNASTGVGSQVTPNVPMRGDGLGVFDQGAGMLMPQYQNIFNGMRNSGIGRFF